MHICTLHQLPTRTASSYYLLSNTRNRCDIGRNRSERGTDRVMGSGSTKMAEAELATLAKQVQEAQKMFDKVNICPKKIGTLCLRNIMTIIRTSITQRQLQETFTYLCIKPRHVGSEQTQIQL